MADGIVSRQPVGWGMKTDKDRIDVLATPVAECPACKEFRLHTSEDWKYHPQAGKGTSKQ